MKHKKSIFWFRQDLRVHDNSGLYACLQNSEEILPIFILDENITDNFWGLTDQKFWFIREALEFLSADIKKLWGDKVIVFKWKPEDIIPELVSKYNIDAIFTNKSYWDYWVTRDNRVAEKAWCNFIATQDFMMVEPDTIEQRKVFTPFYKLWQKHLAEFPEKTLEQNITSKFTQLTTQENTEAKDFIDLVQHPFFTMEFGQLRFDKYIRNDYDKFRNDLDKDGTTKLAPYLRFWVFSIRQLYNKWMSIWEIFISEPGKAAKWKNPYVSELAWREFWWHIKNYFPETKNREFQEKRRHIKWDTNPAMFQKWCDGETGYPIIDAAMKQLNTTNWMHGRARMVVASFLTKDMHIDWRLWEQYFKKMLLDYDEAVNLWNWQWSASVWADPKPLRIFSPLLQSKKFDPDCKFIRKYIPELQFETPKSIHDPISTPLSYCPIIVDHSEEQRRAREIYKGEII